MNHEPNIKTASELGITVNAAINFSDLIGVTWGIDGLLLTEADLTPEFFDLKTGLAGELFQKLVNYKVPTAIVLPDFSAYGERFFELAFEHTKHPLVRFFGQKQQALDWLRFNVIAEG